MVILETLKGRIASLLFIFFVLAAALTIGFFPVQFMRLGKAYSISNRSYKIIDSLPDLSLSIRRFEAFRMYDSGSYESNQDGSISYAPDHTRILKLEYAFASQTIDSVVIIDFIEDSTPKRNSIKKNNGNFIEMRFVDSLKSTFHTQSHFALICSYPRPIKRYFPGFVHYFEPIEGAAVKQVGSIVPLRWGKNRRADTIYSAKIENIDLEIFSKKNDIAIINGLEEDKCVSIYTGINGWITASAPQRSISIFRNVLDSKGKYSIAIARSNTFKEFLLRKAYSYNYYYMSR